MKENSEIINLKNVSKRDISINITDDPKKTHDICEELEKQLKIKDNKIIELQKRLKYSNERIHDVIYEKNVIEKQLNKLEFQNINLQTGKFEQLKNEYNQLVHRLHITKKQLDNTRKQIKLQNQFIEESKDQIKFMEKVIDDLEKRGIVDILLNRSSETFKKYKKI